MAHNNDDKRRPSSEVAAEWFVRLKDGDLSEAERHEYLHWLKKSPEHVAEMLQVSRIYGVLRGALRSAKPELLIPDDDATANIIDLATRSLVPSESRRVSARRWKIAAAFSLVTLASLLGLIAKVVWLERPIETAAAQWQNVPLADGSMVRMGPYTRLRVEFGDTQRFVHLQRGEAYFEVAKDSRRPFIVNAEPVDVRAVGTQFEVAHRDNAVTVTVKEGAVAVSRSVRSVSPRIGSGTVRNETGDVSVPVSAGQQISVSRFWPVAAQRVDVERELAWTQKRLIFNLPGDTIAAAVDEFNRRNAVRIELGEGGLAAHPIRGVFAVDDPESFVQFLEKNAGAVVIREKSGVLRLESRAQLRENRGITQLRTENR